MSAQNTLSACDGWLCAPPPPSRPPAPLGELLKGATQVSKEQA